jgi:hypothetical protein
VASGQYTETFYVCEGGDGTLPETATCGTAYDAADFSVAGNWDVDDQDDGKIGPNDFVALMDDGGDIRGTLTTRQPGLSAKPITIGIESGDSPVVNGADVISTWTEEGAIIQPDTPAGLEAWYKADALVLNDNDAVSSWTDSSGNGNHAVQADANRKPVYKTGIVNSLPVVRFDGVASPNDDMLADTFDATVTQPDTVFVVFSQDTAATSEYVFDGIDATERQALWLTAGDLLQGYAGLTGLSYAFTEAGNFVVISILFNGASSWIREDRTEKNTGDVSTKDLDGLTLGNRYGATWTPFDGDIAEFILYDASLSTANRDGVEEYLGDKYALWSTFNADTYSATVTTEADQVFMDDVLLTEGSDQYSLADHEWFWTGNVLYVRDASGDPDVTGVSIEASQRDNTILVQNSYITIENMTVKYANEYSIKQGAAVTNNIIVDSVTVEYNLTRGISFHQANEHDDGRVTGCTVRYNGEGITINLNANTWQVDNNTVHNNSTHNIKFWASNNANQLAGLVVENNEVYSSTAGYGIWLDEIAAPSTRNIVRYNISRDNYHGGIFIEKVDNTDVYYNLTYGNVTSGAAVGSIGIKASGAEHADDNHIYNNVSYGSGKYGFYCGVFDEGAVPRVQKQHIVEQHC